MNCILSTLTASRVIGSDCHGYARPSCGEDFANTATSASYSMPPQCQGWLKRCFIAPAKSGGRSCSLSFNFVSCRMKKTRQKQNDVYVTSAHFSLLSKRCFLVLAFLFCVSPSRKGTPKNFISWLQELLAEGSVECVLYGGTSVLLPPVCLSPCAVVHLRFPPCLLVLHPFSLLRHRPRAVKPERAATRSSQREGPSADAHKVARRSHSVFLHAPVAPPELPPVYV